MKIGIGSISIPSPFLLKIQSIPRPRIPITLPVVVLCFRRGERRGGKSGRSESTYVTRGGRKGWQGEKSNGEVKERKRERESPRLSRTTVYASIRNNERVNFSSLSTCPTLSLFLFFLSLVIGRARVPMARRDSSSNLPSIFVLPFSPSFFFKLFSRRSRNFNSGTAKLFQFSRFLRLGLIKRRKRTVFLSLSIGWDTRLSNLSLLIFNNNEWLLAILACISILFFLSLFL